MGSTILTLAVEIGKTNRTVVFSTYLNHSQNSPCHPIRCEDKKKSLRNCSISFLKNPRTVVQTFCQYASSFADYKPRIIFYVSSQRCSSRTEC